METWKITVIGAGCHHNSRPEIDADLALKDFVDTLKKQGHTLKEAKFEMSDYDGNVFEYNPMSIDLLKDT